MGCKAMLGQFRRHFRGLSRRRGEKGMLVSLWRRDRGSQGGVAVCEGERGLEGVLVWAWMSRVLLAVGSIEVVVEAFC